MLNSLQACVHQILCSQNSPIAHSKIDDLGIHVLLLFSFNLGHIVLIPTAICDPKPTSKCPLPFCTHP